MNFQNCCYVVGNTYREFANFSKGITYNCLINKVNASEVELKNTYLVLGQSVGKQKYDKYLKRVDYLKHSHNREFINKDYYK